MVDAAATTSETEVPSLAVSTPATATPLTVSAAPAPAQPVITAAASTATTPTIAAAGDPASALNGTQAQAASGTSDPQTPAASSTTSTETTQPTAEVVAALVSTTLVPLDPAAVPAIGPDPPTATLTIPSESGDDCGQDACLLDSPVLEASGASGNASGVTVTVQAVAASGLTIESVVLQYEPSGTTDDWAKLNYTPVSPPASSKSPCTSTAPCTYTTPLSYSSFPANPTVDNPLDAFDASGDYDVRAAVTDSDGQVGYSNVVSDVVVVDDDATDAYVGMELAQPAAALSGRGKRIGKGVGNW